MSRALTYASLAVTLLLGGCCLPRHSGPAPEVLQRPTMDVTSEAREMAALAFVSYVGELIENTDTEVERQLLPCTVKELERQPLLAEKWELVWGPAVHRFAEGELDDNMMFVVRHREQRERLVVSVRGTNSKAILDWLVEDFEVIRTVAWQWQQGEPDLHPRISEGTSNGLDILEFLKPRFGPAAGQRLRDFLRDQVANERTTSITVVGHSLGGALAPALGLWLEDTREHWDSDHHSSVSVWGFAGPTPGDADFARYYEARLGDATQRVHNPYDVVPHAWQKDQLERVPGLYKPTIKPPFGVGEAVCVAIDLTERNHYTQQLADAPPTEGHLFTGAGKYFEQIGCQHTCGYYRALGLVVWDQDTGEYIQYLKPISEDCSGTAPAPRCSPGPHQKKPTSNPCPGWAGTP